jgi:hypothetical protein
VTETRTFGQLVITETDKGTSIGVPGEPMRVLESSPEALAEFVRTDDFGRYRPLSGANTLPTGWKVALSEQLPLDLALEIVYPLALAHQRQLAQGALRVVPLEDVLARQSGRYEDAGNPLSMAALGWLRPFAGAASAAPSGTAPPAPQTTFPVLNHAAYSSSSVARPYSGRLNRRNPRHQTRPSLGPRSKNPATNCANATFRR